MLYQTESVCLFSARLQTIVRLHLLLFAFNCCCSPSTNTVPGAISLVPDAETGFIDLAVDFLAAPDVQIKPDRLPPQKALDTLDRLYRTESTESSDSFYRVGSADFSDGGGGSGGGGGGGGDANAPSRPPTLSTTQPGGLVDDTPLLSEQDKEAAVDQLTSMGFPRDMAKGVLEAVSYNIDAASQLLLEDAESAPSSSPDAAPVVAPAPAAYMAEEVQLQTPPDAGFAQPDQLPDAVERQASTVHVVINADALAELCGMGFPEDMVRNVLQMTNNNVEQATEVLLG
jgi:hypothetical protein